MSVCFFVVAKLCSNVWLKMILVGARFYTSTIIIFCCTLAKVMEFNWFKVAVFLVALVPMIGYHRGIALGILQRTSCTTKLTDDLLK